ncbi:dioxygenase [Kineococcus gynurae]|uniref:Dioxygenase n=1 Tax=Kineococcus gynurae TaxID=452979 RepID=A0ABV5LU83_9ACTN
MCAYRRSVTTAAPPVRMPALYIGHGAPPLLDDALWSGQLAALAAGLPRPTAVLVVSAHWESAPLSLTATAAGTPLVYDFSGFDPRYSRMTYRSPDASALAAKVTALMPATQSVHTHTSRGLDHGAWVPMRVMYPEADVPVLQLSIPTHDPQTLLELGRRLRPLREEGVLVVGSGFLTHGLRFLRDWSIDATPPGWSVEFDAWAAEALARGDVDELAAFVDRAPGMPYAHPTVEHFSPLFVTLGLADDPGRPTEAVIDGFWLGLAKRSFAVS